MEHSHEGTVLLDVGPGLSGEFDASFLERNGHPVLVCRGPAVGPCPLLGGSGCAKFDAAHGIVFAFDLDRPEHRAILERYRASANPDVPIQVVVPPEQVEQYREVLAGVEVWSHEPTPADLDGFAALVEAADRFAE